MNGQYHLGNDQFQSTFTRQVTPERKLGMALLAMAVVVVVGTLGFAVIESLTPIDALYLTIITLSTVGFGDIVPLAPAGRLLAMGLVVFGVLVGAFTATTLGQMVLEGQFREIFGRKKMKIKIGKLSNHYIIAGFGRVGQQVALEFARRRVPFVVVEREAEPLGRLMKGGYLFVEGEATKDDILRQAGIEQAHTLVSTLPDEAQNVYLTLSARAMNKSLNIIARADYEGGDQKLMRAGASHVVSPHVIGGQRMAMASIRPNVVDFMTMTSLGEGDLSIEEVILPDQCALVGKTLMDSKLKDDYGVTIIGIKKIDSPMNIAPGPREVLEAADTLVLIGPNQGLEKLTTDLTNC